MPLEDVQIERDDSEAVPPRNRRRRFAGCALIALAAGLAALVVFLLLLNGPGFRILGKTIALHFAEKQGIQGNFAIDGTLWSGFTLNDVDLSGKENPLVSLKVEEATVAYNGWDLVRHATDFGWLDLVRIQKATIEIALPNPDSAPKKEPKEKKPSTGPAKDFSPFWNLLDSSFELAEIDLVVRQGEKTYQIDRFSLQSLPGEDGRIEITGLSIPNNDAISPISAVVRKDSHSISLQSVQIGEISNLKSLSVAETKPGVFEANTELQLAGASLSANFSTKGVVVLDMREGSTLKIPDLPVGDELREKIGGRVTDLGLKFTGDFADPSTWEVNGSLVASQIRWDNVAVDTFALAIRDNKITLQADLPGTTIKAAAFAPLDSVRNAEALSTVPVDIDVSAEVDSLAETLAPFAPDLPLDGKISAEAKNIQLVRGKTVQSGNLFIFSDSLNWDGKALSTLQIAGNVKTPESVDLTVEAGLDRETQVGVSGNLNPQLFTYTANAIGAFSTGGRLGALLADFNAPHLSGNATLKWQGEGNLAKSQHSGDGALTLKQFRVNDSDPIGATVTATYQDKNIRIPSLAIQSGNVSLYGSASWDGSQIGLTNWKVENQENEKLSLSASLPFSAGAEFLHQQGPVKLDLNIKDLTTEEVAQLSATSLPLAGTLNGDVSSTGTFQDLSVKGDLLFKPRFEGASPNAALDLDLNLRGNISQPESWQAKLEALLSGLRWKNADLEQLQLIAETEANNSGKFLTAQLSANQSGASLNTTASIDLTDAQSFSDLTNRAVGLDLQLNAPDLAPVWRDFAPENLANFPVSGGLKIEVTDVRVIGSSVESGKVSLQSDSLSLAGESLQSIDIEGHVPETNRIEATVSAIADELSGLTAGASYNLIDQTYDATMALQLDLAKDGVLKRILANRKIASLLPKSTRLDLKASGDVKQKKIDAVVDLDAADLSLADGAEPVDIKIDGSFRNFQTASASLALSSRILDLKGAADWHDKMLTLANWEGTAAGTRVFSLTGSVPLDPDKLTAAGWFSQTAPLSLSLETNDLSLASLFPLFQAKPPLKGRITVDLKVGGTPALPELTLDTKLADLAVPGEKEYAVGQARLNLKAKESAANLAGTYQHPDVKPLSLEASLPFLPGDWANGKRKILDEEFRASARMEKSPLAFLQTQVPGIESIDGTVAIDAKAHGTLSKPVLSGAGNLDIKRLRFDDRNAPDLKDIDSVIRFSDNRVTLERLRAIVAGGIVEATGTAQLAPGNEPQLNFHVQGSEVLVVRTPDVTVRTDADIRVSGPWSAVSVAGELGIVNSRFFKNVDLLPIGLPTAKKKSSLPTVQRAPRGGGAAYTDLDFGVKVEPFQNWPVNVRIYTKTPFLIRGNLAESEIEADLSLSGTLGRPIPNGYVKIAEGELSLPFSTVDVETGRIKFDASTGFNGAVEFKARAKADRYRINIFLYNRILNPKYVLTSNPPMPSEDILTLLATGTTRDELIGEDAASVATSKAATLFFKNLRKASAAEKERSVLDELEERTELEIGGVNPETGEQTFGGKIRLWKQLFFVGDVDSDSDYRALLKYVFRFR